MQEEYNFFFFEGRGIQLRAPLFWKIGNYSSVF